MNGTLHSLLDAWWSWTAALSVQTAVLAAIVWLLDLSLRRRAWPQVRYALWALVFVKLLLPPTLALPSSIAGQVLKPLPVPPQATVAVLRVETPRPALSAPTAPAPLPATAASPSTAAPGTPSPSDAPSHVSWKAAAATVWLLGAAAFAAWLLSSIRSMRRIIADAGPEPAWAHAALEAASARTRLRRAPRVVTTPRITGAAVFGVLRPVVILPSSWNDGYSAAQLEHILLHEAAHIRRGDLLVNALQSLLHVVFWFHPFVWLAGRRLRELRELCCDASVARVLRSDTADYRDTLVEAGRRIVAMQPPVSLGLIGLFENPARFSERLEHLTRASWRRRGLRIAVSAAVVLAMSLFVIPMARLTAASPEPLAAPAVAAETDTPDAVADPAFVATGTVEVTGTLVDESGMPAGGVEVTAYGHTYIDKTYVDLGPVTATTRADGTFRMLLPRSAGYDGWRFLSAPDGRLALGEMDLAAGAVPQSALRMTLESRDGRVVGTVVDDTGAPVPGVKASVFGLLSMRPRALNVYEKLTINGVRPQTDNVHHRTDLAPLRDWFTTYTRSDGFFEITGLPKGYAADVWFSLDGYATARPYVANPDSHGFYTDGGALKVTLPRAGRIEGRVIAADPSTRLGGFRIHPLPTNALESYTHGTTLDDGTFVIEGLASGEYELTPLWTETAGWTWTSLPKVTVASGQTSPATINLVQGGVIKGRVVDRETKEPIAYAGVNVRDRARKASRSGHTDEDGFYSVPVPPGTWDVTIGYSRVDRTYPDRTAAFDGIEVAAGGVLSMPDIELQRTPVAPAEDTTALEAALQRFYDAYMLKDDESFRIMPAPFIPERIIYYRRHSPDSAADAPDGPSSILLKVTGDRLHRWGESFGKGTVTQPIIHALGVGEGDVEGDSDILNHLFPADVVWRDGAPAEAVVRDMAPALSAFLGTPVVMEFREVERPVCVIRGTYHLNALDYLRDKGLDTVEIYGTQRRVDESSGGGGSGPFTLFATRICSYTGYPVVVEATEVPKSISWLDAPRWRDAEGKTVHTLPNDELALVLRHLGEQTGLSYTIETRMIRVLFVEKGQQAA